jgi:NADPH:quinone reductase-like Zn-dependent oxidoreductase
MPVMRPTDLIVRVTGAEGESGPGASIARGADVRGVVVDMGSQVAGFTLGEHVAGPSDCDGCVACTRVACAHARRIAGPGG